MMRNSVYNVPTYASCPSNEWALRGNIEDRTRVNLRIQRGVTKVVLEGQRRVPTPPRRVSPPDCRGTVRTNLAPACGRGPLVDHLEPSGWFLLPLLLALPTHRPRLCLFGLLRRESPGFRRPATWDAAPTLALGSRVLNHHTSIRAARRICPILCSPTAFTSMSNL